MRSHFDSSKLTSDYILNVVPIDDVVDTLDSFSASLDKDSVLKRKEAYERSLHEGELTQTLDKILDLLSYDSSGIDSLRDSIEDINSDLAKQGTSDSWVSSILVGVGGLLTSKLDKLGKTILNAITPTKLLKSLKKIKPSFSSSSRVSSPVSKGLKSPTRIGSVFKSPVSKIGVAATAVNAGLSIYDYATANSEAGREKAIGSGVGSTIGGVVGGWLGGIVGSVVPGAGTAAGAGVGSVAGSWLGNKLGVLASKLFHDVDDDIPDAIKKRGAVFELIYIDSVLEPATKVRKVHIELMSYRKSLLSKLRASMLHLARLGGAKTSYEIISYLTTLFYDLKVKSPASFINIRSELNRLAIDLGVIEFDAKSFSMAKSNSLSTIARGDSAIASSNISNPSTATSGAAVGGVITGSSIDSSSYVSDISVDGSELALTGSLVAKYETSGGNYGTVSSGKGDHGGVSYGKYQFASRMGAPQRFLKASGYANAFKGLRVNSKAFKAKWKSLAATDPNFGKAQDKYAYDQYYKPILAKIKSKTGIDLSKRSVGVKAMLMSLAIQHGSGGGASLFAKSGVLVSDDDATLLKKVYSERARKDSSGHLVHFRSSSLDVQQGVYNRLQKEVKDAIRLSKAHPNSVKASATSHKPGTPRASVDTTASTTSGKVSTSHKPGTPRGGNNSVKASVDKDLHKKVDTLITLVSDATKPKTNRVTTVTQDFSPPSRSVSHYAKGAH